MLNALVSATYNTDSPFARNLASNYGEQIVVPLLKLASNDSPGSRVTALGMMTNVISKNPQLSTPSKNTLKAAFRTAVGDKQGEVRRLAVHALSDHGDASDLPRLQQLANADGATMQATRGGPVRYPVREEAQKAMAAIRQRQSGR